MLHTIRASPTMCGSIRNCSNCAYDCANTHGHTYSCPASGRVKTLWNLKKGKMFFATFLFLGSRGCRVVSVAASRTLAPPRGNTQIRTPAPTPPTHPPADPPRNRPPARAPLRPSGHPQRPPLHPTATDPTPRWVKTSGRVRNMKKSRGGENLVDLFAIIFHSKTIIFAAICFTQFSSGFHPGFHLSFHLRFHRSFHLGFHSRGDFFHPPESLGRATPLLQPHMRSLCGPTRSVTSSVHFDPQPRPATHPTRPRPPERIAAAGQAQNVALLSGLVISTGAFFFHAVLLRARES